MTPSKDYTELLSWLSQASAPMIAKLQTLEDKVDKLSQDRVTRTDIEKLRAELVGTMVPRDGYEARHQGLIARDTQIEDMVRELRKDYNEDLKEMRAEISDDLQKIHDRLESGKQQIEDRLKQAQEAQLSVKDRAWIRFSQLIGFAGILIALIDLLWQHVGLH